MIDVDGQLFEATPDRAGDAGSQVMPTLTGPDGQSATVLAMYHELGPLVAPLHVRLAMLELQARGSWRAQLAGLTDDGTVAPGSGAKANPATGRNAARRVGSQVGSPVGQQQVGPRAVIELGSGTAAELAERRKTFVATAPEVAARHQRGVADIEMADLRHVGGYALRIKGVVTEGGDASKGTRRQGGNG
jgi:cell division protein FtsQ